MKKLVSPNTVVSTIFSLILPLSAQNLTSSPTPSAYSTHAERFSSASAFDGAYEVPELEKIQGKPATEASVICSQDSLNLNDKESSARGVDAVVDLDILRNPSPYRKVMVSTRGQKYEISTDSLETGLAKISAIYRESGKSEESSDCMTVALSAEQRIKLDPSTVLEVVESEVGANPSCACEIVKTAILTTDANSSEVVAIVEAAILVSPESMRMISQCAIAANPDSITAVQALLTRLDPNAGDSGYSSKSSKSSKGSKGAKVATIVAPPTPNPLDLPPAGPPLTPVPIVPPFVTEVNP